jgi:nitrous oxidase accessory protein
MRLARRVHVLPWLGLLALGGAGQAQDVDAHLVAASAQVEGRPERADRSPLQARLDSAAPGATVLVTAGTYVGDLLIERPVRLIGQGRPRLVGSGHGSVVRVRAAGVSVVGFDIDGRSAGDLGRDTSGIHVAAADVRLHDCRIEGALFGIYLREAHGAQVTSCRVRGVPGREPGEKGSGIHVWNTRGFRLEGNEVVDTRDGFYVQSSSHGFVRGNRAHDLRYGLHYMFSDDNVFEDNQFENGAAGTALMYSRRITFRRNRFLHNRGFASVGLLLKACDDVLAEDNLVADNARGVFLEGSYGNVFRRNVVAGSDVAVVLYDSCARNRFEGNAFIGNLSPLELVGRRTDTRFHGNYYSSADGLDLDGDGLRDEPYRLTSVFDHLRGNLAAADLFARGLAAGVLGAAERALPVLRPIPVEDQATLVRPPSLPQVPRVARADLGADARGYGVSLALVGLGLLSVARARRPAGRGRA